jgi:cytochrome b6-f complex iron-sulfur subunit
MTPTTDLGHGEDHSEDHAGPSRRRGRAVLAFAEALLGQRRPRAFRVAPEDAALLRAAIELRALRPEDAEPSAEFVTRLHQRLAEEPADDDPPAGGPWNGPPSGREPRGRDPLDAHPPRRRVLRGASIAATAAAVSVAADRLLGGGPERTGPAAGGRGGGTLRPRSGAWQAVMASADLAEGAVRGFDAGTVFGFVQRENGRLQAVSGACTHQGCRLALNSAARRLDCPCHRSSFTPSGELIRHQLPVPPPALPRLAVREDGGQVQVYLPRTDQ